MSLYPYHFREPFAAYLIPKDLAPGEPVWLNDIIEDIVAARWNQGGASRLKSHGVIWNGSDFEIQFTPDENLSFIVG